MPRPTPVAGWDETTPSTEKRGTVGPYTSQAHLHGLHKMNATENGLPASIPGSPAYCVHCFFAGLSKLKAMRKSCSMSNTESPTLWPSVML